MKNRFTHTKAIILSGLIWMAVGFMLLYKGLHFLVGPNLGQGPIVAYLAKWNFYGENALLLIVCLGLFFGFIKGRFALSKTVKRMTNHILSLPLPLDVKRLYNSKYLLLLGVMLGLGVSMRFFPTDVRGFVDVAVGSALVNGAFLYFKNALFVKNGTYEV